LTLISALQLAAVAGEDFGGGEVFGDVIDGAGGFAEAGGR